MLCRSAFPTVAATLACSLVAACDSGDQVAKLQAVIEASPATLAFGEVPLGATKRGSVLIKNTGSLPVDLHSIVVDLPFSFEGGGAQIAPGAETSVDVIFHPELLGWAEAKLKIASSAQAFEVAVSATSVDGLVAGNPPLLVLDDVTLDTSRTAAFVIANYGETPVRGTLIAEGFERPAHFAGGPLPAMAPVALTLDGRDNTEVELTYSPTAVGPDGGRIMFEFCGPRCGVEIAVAASGTASALRVDPVTIDFGQIELGQRAFARAALVNQGTQPIDVHAITVAGDADVLVRPTEPLPATIDAGARFEVDLEYVAGRVTQERGELVIGSTDPSQAELRVPMVGVGRGAEVQITPEVIEFGVTRTTDQQRRSLLVVNAGNQAYSIERIERTGAAVFSLTNFPALPLRLFAGESLDGAVTFTPNLPGAYEGMITVHTDRAGAAPYEIPVRGGYADDVCLLDLTPRRVSFGIVPTQYSIGREVTVTNSGVRQCVLLGGRFDTGSSSDFSVAQPSWPITLDPGAQHKLTVSYRPTVQSIAKATFVIRTDDTLFDEHPLQLVGNANLDPTLFTQPPALDFGGPQCGATTTRNTFLYNTGTDRVVIERVQLDDPGFSVAFARQPPFALDAGDNVRFDVEHATGDPSATGVLIIGVRGRADPLNVPLRVRDASTTDSFQQSSPADVPPVDVLFAISNNCVMPAFQRRLVNSFKSFVQGALAAGNDFRIGVTSTRVGGPNAGEDGRLRGPVLTPSTPDIEQAFREQGVMGGIGGHFEEGLNTMLQAIERAERRETPNVDLFRPGTKRLLVIISNEGDFSPREPAYYLNELRRREGNGVTHELVMIVSGVEQTCRNTNPTDNYPEFATLSGAELQSICQPDWDISMSELGGDTFGLRTRFRLSQPATTGTVEVRIDGVQIVNGWTLSGDGSAIRFGRGAEPAAGSTIEVRYATGC